MLNILYINRCFQIKYVCITEDKNIDKEYKYVDENNGRWK